MDFIVKLDGEYPQGKILMDSILGQLYYVHTYTIERDGLLFSSKNALETSVLTNGDVHLNIPVIVFIIWL